MSFSGKKPLRRSNFHSHSWGQSPHPEVNDPLSSGQTRKWMIHIPQLLLWFGQWPQTGTELMDDPNEETFPLRTITLINYGDAEFRSALVARVEWLLPREPMPFQIPGGHSVRLTVGCKPDVLDRMNKGAHRAAWALSFEGLPEVNISAWILLN